MQSESDAREQQAEHSWQAVLRSAGIALLSSLCLLAVVGLIGRPTTAAGLDSISNVASGSLEPSAYPYRLKGSGSFTIGLPSASRPTGANEVSVNSRIYLPIMERRYPLPLPLFAVQLYGGVYASTGLTWVVASGATWVRVPIPWSSVEPANTTPDNYNWGSLDVSMKAASDAGIRLVATIDYNPSWAAIRASGLVTDLEDLRQFVGAVVARYPQVTYWEFYNEPDRAIHGPRFGFDGAHYALMLQSIYTTVKEANLNAQVVMGGIAFDNFFDEGGWYDRQFLTDTLTVCRGTPCFDIANFHAYPTYRARWEPYGRDISGKAAFIRQVLANFDYNRPLMNTETAWWPKAEDTPMSVHLELAARYVPKTFVRAWASGLLVASWYALHDGADGGIPGLIGPDWLPRPSFTAYQTMITVLGQAEYVRAIPSSETGAAQIEAYQFSVPGTYGAKRLDIYWYDCPSMITLYPAQPADCADTAPLQINALKIGMINKLGVKTILNDGDDGYPDGKVTILGRIGSSPIYIDYQP